MSSTTAQRRKVPKAPGSASLDSDLVPPANPPGNANGAVQVATVRRRKFGTGAFDEHWLNVDCCGLTCALITYMLHAYAVYTVCFIMIPPWMSSKSEEGIRSLTTAGIFHSFVFTGVAIMACLSHFFAMTTNPGAVPPDAKPVQSLDEAKAATNGEDEPKPKQQKGMRLCRRCNAFKPRRAHHCSVCRRCIIKMDHHCPWVNNCVGIGNHKYFLLFVFYTLLSCAYTIVILISWFTVCMQHQGRGRNVRDIACLDSPKHLLNLLGLVVEAVLFGMFTSCMMFDQSDVIASKMTHIDRLKGGGEVGVASLGGVAEVFGVGTRGGHGNSSRFRLDWLSPFAQVCFPPSVRDDIMGFCRPCIKACTPEKDTELTPLARGPRNAADIV